MSWTPAHQRASGALFLACAAALASAACSQKTGALTPAQQQRLESEGILRRADDLIFRYTHDAGRRDAGWEDRKASIIVTKQSVIIHKNEKLGLDLARARLRHGRTWQARARRHFDLAMRKLAGRIRPPARRS